MKRAAIWMDAEQRERCTTMKSGGLKPLSDTVEQNNLYSCILNLIDIINE